MGGSVHITFNSCAQDMLYAICYIIYRQHKYVIVLWLEIFIFGFT